MSIRVHPRRPEVMICQHCQAELMEGSRFCSQCGTAVPELQAAGPVVCQRCQTELVEGSEFCSQCGKIVPEPQAAPGSFNDEARNTYKML